MAVVGQPGNTQGNLSWSARGTGGAAITDYIVHFSSGNGGSWTTFGDGISAVRTTAVTGLTNGISYVFHVAAVNAIGTSAFFSISAPVIPATVPFLVGPLTVRQGAFPDQVILRWPTSTAATTGGSPVTGYTIRCSLDNGVPWRPWDTALPRTGTFMEYAAKGLSIGEQTWFQVAATHRVGTRNWITSIGVKPIG